MFGIQITEKKKTITSLLLVPILLMTLGAWSCNPADVAARINAVLSQVGPAVQLVVALLPLLGTNLPPQIPNAVHQWVPVVQSDVTQISTEITNYKNQLATDTTVQEKINGLIAQTQKDIASILPVFQVLDPATQQKVTNIINAVAALVASAESMIATAEGKTQLKKVSDKGLKLSFSKKDAQKNFNEVLHANFPSAEGLK